MSLMRSGRHVLLFVAVSSWLGGCAAANGIDEALPPATSMLAWTPEQTLVGFRNVEAIFPTRRVARGDAVRPFSRTSGELEVRFGWNDESWDVDAYMAAHRITGILVLEGEAIRLERYAHGRTADDRWASFSVAKSVTSTLVGAAIRDGYIDDLDAPVTDTLPELVGSAYDGVTVRELLTMSSGVAWNEDYADPESDVERFFAAGSDGESSPITAYLGALPRAHPPGDRFNYNTGETELVGLLVSRATGRTLAGYLEEKVWTAYGMEHDALWQQHDDGHETGGCCLNMTLRDYARFGRFALEGGAILPEDWFDLATRPHVDLGDGQGYGFQWWTRDGTFQARGIFGQMILVDPALDLVIAINAAWPNPGDADLWGARWAFVQAVRKALQNGADR